MCQSTLSSVTTAELAAAAPGTRLWFQLYWSSDRGFTADLLAGVAEAGFEAVVFTVDFPAAGRRERDLRSAFTLPTTSRRPTSRRCCSGRTSMPPLARSATRP